MLQDIAHRRPYEVLMLLRPKQPQQAEAPSPTRATHTSGSLTDVSIASKAETKADNVHSNLAEAKSAASLPVRITAAAADGSLRSSPGNLAAALSSGTAAVVDMSSTAGQGTSIAGSISAVDATDAALLRNKLSWTGSQHQPLQTAHAAFTNGVQVMASDAASASNGSCMTAFAGTADITDGLVMIAVPGEHSRKPQLAQLLKPYLPEQPKCLEVSLITLSVSEKCLGDAPLHA